MLERFHFLRQQAAQRTGDPCRSLGGLRRARRDRPARPHRRLRGHERHRAERAVRQVPSRARRLQRDHGRGARRPAGRGVRRVPAQAGRDEWGYGREENLTNGGAHPREVPRHPAGRRLPRLPRPHREGHALAAARRRDATPACTLTESFAMWPGSSVSGLYFAHPESRYFRARQDRPRPGGRLPRPQGHDASPKSNAGSAQTSTTTLPPADRDRAA